MSILELVAIIPIVLAPDVECLAKNIYFEARNQSIQGQVAVAQVTRNRVKSKDFPNNYCDVVWQKNQFSWTHDGKSDHPKDKIAYIQSIQIAHDVIVNKIKNDPTNGSTHYHANYVDPCWNKDYKYVTTIGQHLFYKRSKGDTCYRIARGY